MKILVVQESDWLKKGPLQQHHLMEMLQSRGHMIQVIDFEVLWHESKGVYSSRKIFQASRVLKDVKVTVIRPAFLRFPLLVYVTAMITHFVEILRQMREFKPDVVVGFDVPNAYVAAKISKFSRVPFIYYLIDVNYLFMPSLILRSFAKFFDIQTVRVSDMIIAINDKLREYYIDNMGANPSRSYVIKAGIDKSKFNRNVDGSSIRRAYGIGKNDIVLFFMGWLYSFSGLKEVANSLLNFKGDKKFRLMILGKGDLYGELLEMRDNNLGEKLILIDWQPYDEVPKYIAASDICLLPAYNNDVMRHIVPIKMYEYMACGKPVISTRLPGIMREFGYNNGVIYVDHPTEVLKKVIELCNDDGSIMEYGSRARKLVEKYSWDKITDDFEDILRNRNHFRADENAIVQEKRHNI